MRRWSCSGEPNFDFRSWPAFFRTPEPPGAFPFTLTRPTCHEPSLLPPPPCARRAGLRGGARHRASTNAREPTDRGGLSFSCRSVQRRPPELVAHLRPQPPVPPQREADRRGRGGLYGEPDQRRRPRALPLPPRRGLRPLRLRRRRRVALQLPGRRGVGARGVGRRGRRGLPRATPRRPRRAVPAHHAQRRGGAGVRRVRDLRRVLGAELRRRHPLPVLRGLAPRPVSPFCVMIRSPIVFAVLGAGLFALPGCDLCRRGPAVNEVLLIGTRVSLDFLDTGAFEIVATPLDEEGASILDEGVEAEVAVATPGGVDATAQFGRADPASDQPLRVALVIDESGSMRDTAPLRL